MKKGKICSTLVALTLLLMSVAPMVEPVLAHQVTMGGAIQGGETYGEFNSILVYPNSESSILTRTNMFNMRRFDNWDTSHAWSKSYAPLDGIQSIAPGMEVSLLLLEEPSKIEDFLTKDLEFVFSITNDGENYTVATQDLQYNEGTQTYIYPNEVQGYKLEFINHSSETQAIDSVANVQHTIKLNYNNMSQDQLAGKEPLAYWVDSQFVNQEPKPTTQKIYVIQPKISGQVKYQELENETDAPQWDTAVVKENAVVQLIENTPAGNAVVGETKTDANGQYTFSSLNNNADSYKISNSENSLSVRVMEDNGETWILSDNMTDFVKGNGVSIGRITDISRYDESFETAFAKVRWNAEFKTINEEGSHAVDIKTIITETKEEPQPTELTVRYVDTFGNTIAPNKAVQGLVGDAYDVSTADYKLNIEGYSFKETEGLLMGSLTDEEQIVTYIYTKNPVSPSVLTVNYIDKLGNTIAPSKVIQGHVGDVYDVSTAEFKLEIKGFTFDKIEGVLSGTLVEAKHTVTFIYDKIPANTSELTVNYVDTFGNTIAPSKVVHGLVGDAYDVSTPTFKLELKGYTFKNVEGLVVGKLTQDSQVVTYIYEQDTVTPVKPVEPEKPVEPTLPATGMNNSFMVLGSLILTLGLLLIVKEETNKSTRQQ